MQGSKGKVKREGEKANKKNEMKNIIKLREVYGDREIVGETT